MIVLRKQPGVSGNNSRRNKICQTRTQTMVPHTRTGTLLTMVTSRSSTRCTALIQYRSNNQSANIFFLLSFHFSFIPISI